jgi:hypothetical protein
MIETIIAQGAGSKLRVLTQRDGTGQQQQQQQQQQQLMLRLPPLQRHPFDGDAIQRQAAGSARM